MTTETDDRLYLGLKGARERLCGAQVLAAQGWQRDELGQAIVHIDRVGAVLPQWSEYDQAHTLPALPRWPNIPTTGVQAGQRPAPTWSTLVLWLVLALAAGSWAGAVLALYTS